MKKALAVTADSLLMDRETFLAGAQNASRALTFTIIWAGAQVAGTLQSYLLPSGGRLIRVSTTAPTVSFARAAVAYPSSSTGWSAAYIGIAGASSSLGAWEGRETFDPNQSLYFDTSGGIGSADRICFVFEVLTG